jgi:hypothetical protein
MNNLFLLLVTILLLTHNLHAQTNTLTASATPDSSTICLGDSVQLDVTLNVDPCTESIVSICTGLNDSIIIGTNTTNISNAPSPYYGFYEDGRIQIIYTAAELNSLGFINGDINAVEFNVTSTAGHPYNNLTIKIGHTNKGDFQGDTIFLTGLTTVYCKSLYTTVQGWNTHHLSNPFYWNGTQNIVVEVCFNNTTWIATDQVAQTSTLTPMTLYDYADGTDGCIMNTPYTPNLNRPNIKLKHCNTLPNPNVYSYSWTPTTGLSNPTIKNPVAFPTSTTNYIVTVSDTLGSTAIDTVKVNVDICTNIDDILNTSFKIYPNPNNGLLKIESTHYLEKEVLIKITTLEGKIILSNKIEQNSTLLSLDLSHLKKGLYFIHLNYANQNIVKKIIRN